MSDWMVILAEQLHGCQPYDTEWEAHAAWSITVDCVMESLAAQFPNDFDREVFERIAKTEGPSVDDLIEN